MRALIVILFIIFSLTGNAQKIKVGVDYGRAYFYYKHKDDGTGFREEPNANYHFLAGFTLSRSLNASFSFETGLRFIYYEQYFSTRKYWGAFEEGYPIIQIPLLIEYKSKGKLCYSISSGLIVGIMPDQSDIEFESVFIYPTVDPIAEGEVKRTFTPIFPLFNVNAGLYYQIYERYQVGIKSGYGKGFIKITEFDVYYNDGNGQNDQHAKQWGTGDFAFIGLSIKYTLKNKKST